MTSWERRIERAEELAAESPVLPELLHFYQEIARFQSTIAGGPTPENLASLLALIRRSAPDPMAAAATGITCEDLLRSADPMHAFFARVLMQARAPGSTVSGSVQSTCPACGEKPVAAVLRPEGDGAKRFLLCSMCFTEWEYRRLLCPNCGEEDQAKLAVYTAAELPHVRVEACDTCRVYLKAIDLTKNGLAVPEVDEIAAVVLDLWAAEHGYTKLQTNLFGM